MIRSRARRGEPATTIGDAEPETDLVLTGQSRYELHSAARAARSRRWILLFYAGFGAAIYATADAAAVQSAAALVTAIAAAGAGLPRRCIHLPLACAAALYLLLAAIALPPVATPLATTAGQAAGLLPTLALLCFGLPVVRTLLWLTPALLAGALGVVLKATEPAVTALTLSAFALTAMLAWHREKQGRHDALRLQQSERRAHFDQLTGLLNRWGFERAARRIERHARRHRQKLTVALLDLDQFKSLNDAGGHAYGDRVLAQVGQCLGQFVRRPLDVCARYGGEEFVLLWCETDVAFAADAGQRMVRAVEALRIEHPGTGGVVTISVGLACGQPDGRVGSRHLLAAADRQLYRAKRAGRNRAEGPPASEQIERLLQA